MSDQQSRFSTPPRNMARDVYMETFSGVYEHSPWIAESLREQGLDQRHDTAEGLATAMQEVLASASSERKMALVRAHPELAGKTAVRTGLTRESSEEQGGAGLDQCTPAEFERFQKLNEQYNQRFGFPFIMAVRGYHREEILEAFERRIAHDPETEFQTALQQVDQIALLRLRAIAETG